MNLVGDYTNRVVEDGWLGKFASALQVYVAYIEENHSRTLGVEDFYGSREEVAHFAPLFKEGTIDRVIRELENNSMEDQIVVETSIPACRVAGISCGTDRNKCYYILIALIREEIEEGDKFSQFSNIISEQDLYKIMDLFRDTGNLLLGAEEEISKAQAQSRRSQSSEAEMSEALKRVGAMTEVVQLLDSDEALEKILTDFCSLSGNYLDIDFVDIFRIHPKNDEIMELLTKWYKTGFISNLEDSSCIKRPDAFYGDKLRAISSGTKISDADRKMAEAYGIKAFVSMPIKINDQISMYVLFGSLEQGKNWQVEEIRFLSDSLRILQSVVTKRIQKNSLAGSFQSLETVLDNVGASVYVRDTDTRKILFSNRNLRKRFSKELEENLLGSIFESGEETQRMDGSPSLNYEIYYQDRDHWYDVHRTPIDWVDGRRVLLTALYDITEKKKYQNRIEQQAYTDFLTGLYNRMCCEKDLAKVMDQVSRQGRKGALLYLDLDDFKHINDGLGHQYGDVLLKAISHAFQQVKGIENTCYRMGGDEFVIIIPPDSYSRYNEIIEDIKAIFAKPWYLKDADYYCTMSMGVVEFTDTNDNIHELIKKADIAMYEAKKSGKNRVSTYRNGANDASNKRLDMEKNMRGAMLDGCREFEVYYQPIVDVRLPGTPCVGAEALVRWNSTELGFISPADFIPLAEYLGLINPIGNYVLEQACKRCKYWNDHGYPNYKVNVNLSVVQLLQSDIVEIIEKIVKDSQINPHNLTLEVTESLAINDMIRMKEILGSIKEMGIRIALDDFGTGYSSLNHIREIPLDVIKVDQNFVKDLAEDSYSQSFVKMVGELADALDVNICVEGIETQSQLEVIEQMNVDLIQGYYFSKPLKCQEFENKYCPKLPK